MNESRPLRLALTKGRLEEKTIELFEKNNIDCTALRDKGRKLIFSMNANGVKLEVILVKPLDVITYVEYGVCDMGIVGKDTIMEHGRSFYEIADLGFGKCRMAFAGKAEYARDPERFFNSYGKKVIATKFENITREYFTKKNTDVDIIKIEGSVEIAPLLGFAQGIVDIVETGSTLRENGLEVIDTVCNISARAIVNTVSMKMRKSEIEFFSKNFEITN